MKTLLACTVALIFIGAADGNAKDPQPTEVEFLAIAAATSDYVYRGVSLRDQKPSPMLYAEARYGILYANGLIIGTYLGEDALGRSLGNLEADGTIGIAPVFGNVELNLGVKYTGYPNGRDNIADTLDKAERDFVEPFAAATLKLSDQFSVGGTVYWTPNYYYETGEVLTVEGQTTITLPAWNAMTSKLTAFVGHVRSEQRDVAAPGNSYLYWNAGIEARVERMILDLRYWDTDVRGIDEFGPRVVFSMGVAIN